MGDVSKVGPRGATPPANDDLHHTVASGETLSSVARQWYPSLVQRYGEASVAQALGAELASAATAFAPGARLTRPSDVAIESGVHAALDASAGAVVGGKAGANQRAF